MASWTPVVLGALMILVGALSVVNHPTIDYFNRLMKSAGTTQRARDIEMSETSLLVGQFLGAILVLVGIWLVATGIT